MKSGKLVMLLSVIIIVNVNGQFEVDASTKTNEVIIKGYNTKPAGENQDKMIFKPGETILLKGMDGAFKNTVLIDDIRIDEIKKSGVFGWWSSPSVTSRKSSGKIEGKKSLAAHLNDDIEGLSWFNNKVNEISAKRTAVWIEKLGDNKKFMYQSMGNSHKTQYTTNDFPHKPGAGGVGKIEPHLKSYLKIKKFVKQQTKSNAHQQFVDHYELKNKYDYDNSNDNQQSIPLTYHQKEMVNNNSTFDTIIIILLMIIISCIGCLFAAAIGAVIGHVITRKSSAPVGYEKMHSVDNEI